MFNEFLDNRSETCTVPDCWSRKAFRLSWTHHLFEEADLHVRVYEGRVVSDEGLGDVGHDAGVVPRKAFSSIHLDKEASPGTLGGETFWHQQVPEEQKDVFTFLPSITSKPF